MGTQGGPRSRNCFVAPVLAMTMIPSECAALWPTNSRMIVRLLCASFLFHVKQRRAWPSLSTFWTAGGARPISSQNSTFLSVWTRHIANSAQLLALAPYARRWLDMGSGAGFPGLVIAIQLVETPGAVVHCVESDQRKCAFLREVARATRAAAQNSPRPRRNPSSPIPSDLWTASPRALSPPCR